jgi:hypothetical protein
MFGRSHDYLQTQQQQVMLRRKFEATQRLEPILSLPTAPLLSPLSLQAQADRVNSHPNAFIGVNDASLAHHPAASGAASAGINLPDHAADQDKRKDSIIDLTTLDDDIDPMQWAGHPGSFSELEEYADELAEFLSGVDMDEN